MSDVQAPSAAAKRFQVEWVERDIMLCRAPTEPGEGPLREYYEAMRRAVAEAPRPFVQISDTTHLTRPSSALERKVHADMSNAMIRDYGHNVLLGLIVIESPFIRATTTAVLWLLRRSTPIETAETLAEAMARARAALARPGATSRS